MAKRSIKEYPINLIEDVFINSKDNSDKNKYPDIYTDEDIINLGNNEIAEIESIIEQQCVRYIHAKEVVDIMYKAGKSTAECAEIIGVSSSRVRQVVVRLFVAIRYNKKCRMLMKSSTNCTSELKDTE